MKILRTNSISLFIVLFFTVPLGASTVIPGNSTEEGSTFSSPMRTYFMSRESNSIYVAAKEPGAKQYSLSIYGHGVDSFKALVPETVALEGHEEKQPNPLYDAPVALLNSLLTRDSLDRASDHPLVVLESEPAALYLLEHHLQVDHFSFFRIPAMIDAMGLPSSKIIALEGLDRIAFAALKNNAGEQFGAPGSGIAMAMRYEVIDEKDETKRKKNIGLKQISVLPLECRSGIIKIEQDLAAMGDIVDMHWDPILERLYIALHVTAADHPLAGARALVTACVLGKTEKLGDESERLNNKYQIIYTGFAMAPFAPATAFDGEDQIIGGVGANTQVSFHKVRTMRTTTELSYLIAIGGNGAPCDTRRTVYALPLLTQVAQGQEFLLGTLAAKDSPVQELYRNDSVSRFAQRVMSKQATEPEDLYTTNMYDQSNAPAHVGGGALLAGDIADLFIKDDAVFVVVADAVAGQCPGVFHSQALFDGVGRIKGWTRWQRVAGSYDSVLGATLDQNTGNFTLLLKDADNAVRTVRKTEWHAQKSEHAVSHAEPQLKELEEFDYGDGDLRVVSGAESLVIKTRDGQTRTSTDYTVPIKLGEIACVERVEGGRIFVGGDYGLVALDLHTKSSPDARAIGDYHFVKKIIQDNHFLYVLSDHSFDRIDLTDESLPITRLASIADLIPDAKARFNMTFFDCVVSGPLAVLASRMGLFRIGDGCDVRRVSAVTEAHWTAVAMPGGYPSATALSWATSTGAMSDLTEGVGGNLYVISSHINKESSRIHRFSVDASDDQVHASIISPIPNIRVKGMPSYFRQCKGLARSFISDGAVFWYTQSRHLAKAPSLRSIKRDNPQLEGAVPLDMTNANRIMGVSRDTRSGSWLLLGDSPTVNE